ncbi:soluble lytic murein transglycosylase-like protein [Natronocella acetinitrilica]|uniref:Soluble lytic murein transglycosylase-like protein n=1 Tax=Natronocella acetinitrilica TaxID=414046 RepID=A0AAE3G2S7_9GAMM|nr:lytic transglycosylase domain-containing protein [Natronocella acetinitrilica]MCP1674589.1 soluble lytic murein transglycosylase-like protein [Natronocella acetinitrilica]
MLPALLLAMGLGCSDAAVEAPLPGLDESDTACSESAPARLSRGLGVLRQTGEAVVFALDQAVFAARLDAAYGIGSERASAFSLWIMAAARSEGAPPELLAAVVGTESSFRTEAVSVVGAIGPAQIRPQFWAEYCGVDLADPAENILCGARILIHYAERYCEGDWRCALAHYNVGPGNLRRGGAWLGAAERYTVKVSEHLVRIEAAEILETVAQGD